MTDNNELLIQSIQQMELKKARKIIIKYLRLHTKYVDITVSRMTDEEILKGDLKGITDEDIAGLLKAFGHAEVEIKKEVEKEVMIQDQKNILLDSYNTSLYEIEKLRKDNAKLKDEKNNQNEIINKQNEAIDELKTKLDNLNNNIFKLFNLTQKGLLKEVSNESIDELYVEYLTKGTKKLKDAFITQKEDGTLIVPKTYFEL